MRFEEAIRAGWSRWTSDPVDHEGWTEANPATGQCASTALVIQDRLGGELLIAEVHEADGSRQGVHYWNPPAGRPRARSHARAVPARRGGRRA